MANVASLALPSSICDTEVAKVVALVAHCTLHGTEGMTICFNISWGPEESCDLKPGNFQVGRDFNCKFIITHFQRWQTERFSDLLRDVRHRLTMALYPLVLF